jgi:hypothetical protein
MSNISISKAASAKIVAERDNRLSVLGRPVIPRLHYYRRSYSTLNDGRAVEHGPGFMLSFVEPENAADDQYLSIDIGDDCTVSAGPSLLFLSGEHCIDWSDRKFTLTTIG